jgi:hypothetical protein
MRPLGLHPHEPTVSEIPSNLSPGELDEHAIL